MSASVRSSRSRSKQSDSITSNSGSNDHHKALKASDTSRSLSPAPPSQIVPPPPEIEAPALSHEIVTKSNTENHSTSQPRPTPSISLPIDMSLVDQQSEGRSSPLSDLEDNPEERDELTLAQSDAIEPEENSSEAETERLEPSPRKFKPLPADAGTIIGQRQYDRQGPIFDLVAPSVEVPTTIKLEKDTPVVASPSDAGEGAAVLAALSQNARINSVSLNGDQGRKRKRTSPLANVDMVMDMDEPARKRSGSAREAPIPEPLTADEDDDDESLSEPDPETEPLQHEEEPLTDLDDEPALSPPRTQVEERIEETPLDDSRSSRSRKPRRRGRKLLEELADHNAMPSPKFDRFEETLDEPLELDQEAEPEEHVEPEPEPEVEAELEPEEEDEATAKDDEELARKKQALEELQEIERKYKIFRERRCDEQIAKLTQELELLQQPNCIHPDYLAMLQCVDARRDEKIQLENTLLSYKLKALDVKSRAERAQIHSQYHQTVRAIRDGSMEQLGEQWFQMQRERRKLQAEEPDYTYKFPNKRSQQVRQQAAYNLEVSVLSGVAKYVGFPAAPELGGARNVELEDDFKNMKIKPFRQPTYIRDYSDAVRADRVAAEEKFFEQTPWANPQHPIHQQLAEQASAAQARPNMFNTPNPPPRIEQQPTNGSVSTIDAAISNPPSSAVLPNASTSTPTDIPRAQQPDAESPTLVRKRNVPRDRDVRAKSTEHPANLNARRIPSIPRSASAVQQAFPTSAIHIGGGQADEVQQPASLAPQVGAYGTPLVTPGANPDGRSSPEPTATIASTTIKEEEGAVRRFGFGSLGQQRYQIHGIPAHWSEGRVL